MHTPSRRQLDVCAIETFFLADKVLYMNCLGQLQASQLQLTVDSGQRWRIMLRYKGTETLCNFARGRG